MRIRNQEFAKKAYEMVVAIKDSKDDSLKVKYSTLALNFPTLILQSGLAQAVGFLMAKGEKEHKKLLEHLSSLLGEEKLHEEIINSDLVTYQLLTRYSIDATSCLKRYTQALLQEDTKN